MIYENDLSPAPIKLLWSWNEESDYDHNMRLYHLFLHLPEIFAEFTKEKEHIELDDKLESAFKGSLSTMLMNAIHCPDCKHPAEPVRAMEMHFLCRNCAWGPEKLAHFDFYVGNYSMRDNI